MKGRSRRISTLVPALAVVASLFCGMKPAIAEDADNSKNIPTVEEARLHALLKQSAGYTSDVDEVLSSIESEIRYSLSPARPNAELIVDCSDFFSSAVGTPILLKAQELLSKKGWSVDLRLAPERGWCGYVCVRPAKELPPVEAYLLDDNEYNTVLARLSKLANAAVEDNTSSVYDQEIPTPDQAMPTAFKQTRASYVDNFNDALNRIAWAPNKLDLDNPGADILVLDLEGNYSGDHGPPKFMVDAQRVATAKTKGQWEIIVSPSRIFGQGFWQLSIRPIKV